MPSLIIRLMIIMIVIIIIMTSIIIVFNATRTILINDNIHSVDAIITMKMIVLPKANVNQKLITKN